jgi:hypothetical protein
MVTNPSFQPRTSFSAAPKVQSHTSLGQRPKSKAKKYQALKGRPKSDRPRHQLKSSNQS